MDDASVVVSLEIGAPARQEVLRYLGYGGQAISPELDARLGELSARCLELARPRACLRSFEVAGGTGDEAGAHASDGADGYMGNQVSGSPNGSMVDRVGNHACDELSDHAGDEASGRSGGVSAGYVGNVVSGELGDATGYGASDHMGNGASCYASEGHGRPELRLKDCALVLEGRDIVRHLRGAQAVAVMAVTLGTPLEQELRRLSLTDPPSEILLDAIATATVEVAADAAEALVAAEARARGLHATWRYSPGYGDFPLETQRPLLAALDAQRRLGLSLTDSFLMIPTKSVTAVIGLVSEPEPEPEPGTEPEPGSRPGCATCPLNDRCSVRAKGDTCHE